MGASWEMRPKEQARNDPKNAAYVFVGRSIRIPVIYVKSISVN